MSWQFGDIDFESYGVFVSKSTGVLDLPKLKTEGYDWLDEDGLDYWQEIPKYNDREIILNCWMLAEADDEFTGYENFKTKVEDFLTEIKEAGKATFKTPYIDIENCSISKGIAVIRETSYVLDIQAGTFLLRITVHGDVDFMQLDIKRWTGTETLTVASVFTNDLKINKTLQGDIYATFSFESSQKLAIKYYDNITVNSNGSNNDVFHLATDPEFRKLSTNKYVYDLRMEHESKWLESSQFLNDRSEADFYYFANMEEILDLIIDNHNRSWWSNFRKGTVFSTERRNHKFSAEDCLSVLRRISNEYNLEYEFEYVVSGTYNINIKKQIANDKAITLEYGKGNGLYELSREKIDPGNICTILFAYGAAKNLKPDYRGGLTRLSFDNNPLKNNEGLHDGAGPHEKTVYFDDIFPNRTSTVTGYEQVLPEDLTDAEKEVWPDGIYKITDSSLEFDLNDYLLGGLTAKIRMKSGNLAGHEFEITKYDHTFATIYIIPFKDERGDIYPNETLLIEIGDDYTLVDISLPSSYIAVAEAELEAAATAYLANRSIPKFPYRVIIDPAFMAANPGGFEVGDRITIIDTDYGINGLFRISNLVYDAYKLTYELTLSDTARLSRRQALEMRLEAVERAQEAARKDRAESSRNNVEDTGELRRRLLGPNDDKLKVDKIIRNESLDPRMLSYDAGIPQFYLKDALVETNVDGDEDKVKINAGEISITNFSDLTLNRYEIAKLKAANLVYNPIRTWIIPETNFTLLTKDGYWIYAKLDMTALSTICVIEVYPEHKEVKSLIQDGFLMYKLGHISSGEEPV